MSHAPSPALPPWEQLRASLEAEADAMEARGEKVGAASIREILAGWWQEHTAWSERAAGALGVHHEINNALVGIRGNAQLLIMNPATQQPGVRERLEVILRESGRIQEAAGRLRELKTGFGGGSSRAHAA